MVAPISQSENHSSNNPGAVVEWQSGNGRTFRFAVGQDGLVVGSAPGADIRLGQQDPPLLAAFRIGTGKNGEGNYLHCRILAPHCTPILNGFPAEIQIALRARDRIEIAGHIGLVIHIAQSPEPPLAERIGAPELAEYAKALEAHAALVDQWHKSLEERQNQLEKREKELQRIYNEVVHVREQRPENGLIPNTDEKALDSESTRLAEPSIPVTLSDNDEIEAPGDAGSSAVPMAGAWEDEGDSWDFLTHPETELAGGQIETSAQYWPPGEGTEIVEETVITRENSICVETQDENDTVAEIPLEIPTVFPSQEIPAQGLDSKSDIFGEYEPPNPSLPGAPTQIAPPPVHSTEFGSEESEPAQISSFPVDTTLNHSIEAKIRSELDDVSSLEDTEPENLENIDETLVNAPVGLGELAGGPLVETLEKTASPADFSSIVAQEQQATSESWTVPLGDFLCSRELQDLGPIEAIHVSGTPKVFVEAIPLDGPIGGHPPWEHENLPRELERQQGYERDCRVWEIPQGPGLMSLELPPVLGIWYRLVLQTVLGVRALHAAGRCLGPKVQGAMDWVVVEPSGLVKLFGPGVNGDHHAADLCLVGQLARELWNKAFGQTAPQPEFIKELLGRLNGQPGVFAPIESLDQLAVEMDRVGLRIRANPYAWAVLLQKTFPGWTSTPSRRLSA